MSEQNMTSNRTGTGGRPILPLILAAVSLLLSVAGICLMLAFAGQVKAQLAELEIRLSSQSVSAGDPTDTTASSVTGGLSGWSLTPTAWENGAGASIALSAIPHSWREGDSARLSVRLGGQEIHNVACSWDGTAYSAAVELDAADGYGYYFIRTDAEGNQVQTCLTSPEELTDDIPVYLADSLTTYASVLVEAWHEEKKMLVLDSCSVYIQLPRLTTEGQTTVCQEAELVLYCNGEKVAKRTVLSQQLGESDAQLSYDMDFSGLTFHLPTLVADDELTLTLEATLSNGQTLTAPAASWFENGGELFFVVG